MAEWLPYVARLMGAKPPLHVPRWLGRLIVGDHIAVLMNDIRGASNAKIKQRLGWRPKYATWRDGFRAAFAEGGRESLRTT